MYITETTINVKEIFDEIEKIDDIERMKFLIYIFNLLNNNQINDQNAPNPDLIDDSKLIIFNFQSIGIESFLCTAFLQYNAVIYNKLLRTKDAIESNGNVLGINYDSNVDYVISRFGRLAFGEKLDLVSELLIRYDNEAYFDNNIIPFNLEYSGYDIAKLIKEFKKNNI